MERCAECVRGTDSIYTAMTYIVMACVVMAYIVAAFTAMAYIVVPYRVMAYRDVK